MGIFHKYFAKRYSSLHVVLVTFIAENVRLRHLTPTLPYHLSVASNVRVLIVAKF